MPAGPEPCTGRAIGADVTYGSRSTPTAVERWLEDRIPGYRFGAVLVLLLVTFVFTACGLEGSWARVVNVFLTGLTLLAALLASRTGRRLFRVAALVVFVALVGAIGATADTVDNPGDGLILLNLLLVAAAPVVIGARCGSARSSTSTRCSARSASTC